MEQKYKVEFTDIEGKKEFVTFTTEDVTKSISQYCRNRAIKDSRIVEVVPAKSKQILLG